MLHVKVQKWTVKSKAFSKQIYARLKQRYEEIYGIDSLERQNQELRKIEVSLLESATQRRTIQTNLYEIQGKIRDTRNLIDKTPRNSDNYMTLFTNEHNLIKKEYDLVTILKLEEEREKEFIRIFSEKIRQSYQIDLVRQSRQKMLSVVFSIFGGIAGYILNAYLNEYKNSALNEKIGQIKGQHEQTLNELNHVSEKLDEIIDRQTKESATTAALSAQLKQQQSSTSTSTSASYLSYLAWPFVKMYRLVL